MADAESFGILERTLTARLDVQRADINTLDVEMTALRDELHADLSDIKETLARVEATSEANAALMAKFLTAIIGGGVTVVVSAVAVILFGPGS